jgi:hypothetical protein
VSKSLYYKCKYVEYIWKMQFSPTKIVTKHTKRMEVGMPSKDYPVSSPSRNRIVWLSSCSCSYSRSNYIHSTQIRSYNLRIIVWENEQRICIHLTMLHAQSAVCCFVLRPMYSNRRYRSSFLTLCSASQSYATGLKYSRRKHIIYFLVA